MLVPRATGGYVDPNIPNPNTDADASIIIYGYVPTLALSILALVLYALLLLLHLSHLLPVLSRRLHAHGPRSSLPFSIVLTLATLLELLGYIFRLQSSAPPVGDPYKVINFVLQYFFIVVAPVFISAGIYTILTSLIRLLGEVEGSGPEDKRFNPTGGVIRRRGIVAIFVVCDVIATAIQVAGAASIGSAESNNKSPKVPNDILLAGLAFQVAAFLVFLILFGLFLKRNWQILSSARLQRLETRVPGGLKGFSIVTLFASLLIYLRTIFRLGETSEGVFGYASTHEAFFGALEFAPVVVATLLLGVWHPGGFVGRLPKREGEEEIGGDGVILEAPTAKAE